MDQIPVWGYSANSADPVQTPHFVLGFYANSADPVQTPPNAASELGLHCLLTEISIENAVKINPPDIPQPGNGLVQMIRMDKSTGQKSVSFDYYCSKLIIQGESHDLEVGPGQEDDDKRIYSATYHTVGHDNSKKGKRKELPFVFEVRIFLSRSEVSHFLKLIISKIKRRLILLKSNSNCSSAFIHIT